jgi:hypothetical protein
MRSFFYSYRLNKEAEDHMLSNFLVSNSYGISQLKGSQADKIHLARKQRLQALSQVVKQDFSRFDTFEELIRGTPIAGILKEYIKGNVSLESLAVLNTLIDPCPTWNKLYSSHPLYLDIERLISKYTPFVQINKPKMKNLLIDLYRV